MVNTQLKSVAFLAFTTLLFLFVAPKNSFAGHVSGGDITYRFSADSVCELEVRFYRDCRGVPLGNPSSATRLRCLTSSKSQVLSLTLVSIKEVTWMCTSAKPNCDPKNTYGTGNGIEEHLFKTTIDFRSSTFKSFISCGDVIIETGQCCRTSAINTGPSGNFYTYLKLDLDHLIKSGGPKFNSTPRVNVCCNQPTYMDFSAKDPDGDSLSYKLTSPLTGYGNSVSYSGKYSFKNPVECYDPTGKGTVNPNYNPPMGFYLDPETGENIFTPVKCDNFSSMALAVEEWRLRTKSSGYDLVSVTHRDINLVVSKCPSNNPPTVTGPYSYQVCLGDSLVFTIKSDDKIYVPPPPLPRPPPDTLTMTWNAGIDGAKFEIVDTTKLNKSGRFSWRPKKGVVDPGKYRFVVTVNDNHCPSPGAVSRTYSIEVLPKPTANFNIDTLGCGAFEVSAFVDSKVAYQSYSWALIDTSGKELFDSSIAHFRSSGLFYSRSGKDTIYVLKGGPLSVRMTTNAKGCKDSKIQDFRLSSSFDPIQLELDTLCEGAAYTLEADSIHNSEITSISWRKGGTTVTTSKYQRIKSAGPERIYVEAKTRFGCTMYDTIDLIAKYKPQIKPLNDDDLCDGKKITYEAIDLRDSGLVMNSFLWSTRDTSASVDLDDGGNYSVSITNSCGTDVESFDVTLHEEYKIDLGADIDKCDVNAVQIGDSAAVAGQEYLWSTAETTSSISAMQSGTYSVTVSNICFSNTDDIEVTLENTPSLKFTDLITYCDSVSDTYDAGNPGASYKWDDNSTGKTKKIDRAGWHFVTVSTKNCGSVTDSTYADLIMSPEVDLGPDTVLKKPFSITFDAGSQSVKYKWSTGATTSSITVTDFGTYYVDLRNSCGSATDTIQVTQSVSAPGKQLPEGWSVYPNPADGVFYLRHALGTSPELTLRDVKGRSIPIRTSELQPGIVKVETSVKSGVYFLEIQVGENAYNAKLIMEK